MFYLVQVINLLSPEDKKLFIQLFSDLDYELEEMGWKGNETELINSMLLAHFGFTIDDDRQLKKITDAILDKNKFKLTLLAIKQIG